MVDDSPTAPSEAVGQGATWADGLQGEGWCDGVEGEGGGGGWLLGRVLELTDERDGGQILPQQL